MKVPEANQKLKAGFARLQQAQYRYKAGLVTYLEVAIAGSTALQARLRYVSIEMRRRHSAPATARCNRPAWRSDAAPRPIAFD